MLEFNASFRNVTPRTPQRLDRPVSNVMSLCGKQAGMRATVLQSCFGPLRRQGDCRRTQANTNHQGTTTDFYKSCQFRNGLLFIPRLRIATDVRKSCQFRNGPFFIFRPWPILQRRNLKRDHARAQRQRGTATRRHRHTNPPTHRERNTSNMHYWNYLALGCGLCIF